MNGRGQGLRNITKVDHFLNPGWVKKIIISKVGMLHIRTEGGGTGLVPKRNVIGVPKLWGDVDKNIITDLNKK